MTSKKRKRQIRRKQRKITDYVERGHMIGARPPKYMCTECFSVFAKRSEGEGHTERCTCGNDDLVRLNPEIPIPRKKANNRSWWEFFKGNFMSVKANVYYTKFKLMRSNS